METRFKVFCGIPIYLNIGKELSPFEHGKGVVSHLKLLEHLLIIYHGKGNISDNFLSLLILKFGPL